MTISRRLAAALLFVCLFACPAAAQNWSGPLTSGKNLGGTCTTPCSATMTSTAGGKLLLVFTEYVSGSSQSLTASGACSGSWNYNPGTFSSNYNSTAGAGNSLAWCAVDTGAATGVTITQTGIDAYVILEWSPGSTITTAESAVGINGTVSGTTTPGVTLVPTASDLLLQGTDNTGCGTLSGGYSAVLATTQVAAIAYINNSSAGAAPTWSGCTNGTQLINWGVAFKGPQCLAGSLAMGFAGC